MAFQFPDSIRKDEDLSELDRGRLIYWHEKMHVVWGRLEVGTIVPEWNLYDVFYIHQELLNLMKQKKIKHISPINSLDLVKEH